MSIAKASQNLRKLGPPLLPQLKLKLKLHIQIKARLELKSKRKPLKKSYV